ncbi:MAG: TolC family protein [Candidatus Omnitrophota bacterium]|jgi:outer membrane protein TolC|nr:MAG: TolC family protein [Candidatus Omnitrophota bacterium]
MKRLYAFALLLFALAAMCSAENAKSTISSSTLTLSVHDSLLMALETNRSLAVERYGPEINRTFIADEGSVFDPVLSSDFSAAESIGQRTSGVGQFTGVSSRSKTANLGISKRTPLGLNVDLEASASTRESNVYTRLYSTRLGTTLTMPLLEGLGSNVNLVGVRLAERDVDISEYELRGFVLALAAQTEEFYWDLLSAREELQIRLRSLDLARQQFTETQDRIDVGEIAEIELAAAEGEVALREEAVIDAHSALEKTALQLLRTLNPPAENLWSLTVDLIDSPSMEITPLDSVETYVAIALAARPDINQARLQLEKQELNIVRTRNGLLPRLDFFLTLGTTGYARTFSDSLSKINGDNFDLTTGFVFEYGLGNRAKRARHERAQFRVEEAQAALWNFEQLIELDVRTAYIEIQRAAKQITATHIATRLQDAKYLAEQEKFRVGKSTNLLVLVAQRDLTQSQLDEIRAQINLRKAIMRLHEAKGTLLDHHHIVLPSPAKD